MEFVWAFFIGGLICLLGQILINYTKLTPARILTSFVILGVVLEFLGLYEKLINFSGAGATVPITGFGSLLAGGVRKAIDEKGVIGVFTGGLTAASGGITAVIVFAVIVAILFKRGDRTTDL